MKLLNENSVLLFHFKSDSTIGQFEIREFNDNCNFSEFYIKQSKRDEFFINFREKLLIAIKNYVYEYDINTNTTTSINEGPTKILL